MSKGRRREKQAADIYERAGFDTYRPPRARGGPTDVFGLFDLLAIGPRGLDMVQVKSNRAAGIEAFCEDTLPFQTTRGLCPLMMVCYDGQGGHDPTPPCWRVVIPSDDDAHVTVVDERDDDTDGDGAGVVEWLTDPREDAV